MYVVYLLRAELLPNGENTQHYKGEREGGREGEKEGVSMSRKLQEHIQGKSTLTQAV